MHVTSDDGVRLPVEGAEVYLLPAGLVGLEELRGDVPRARTDETGTAVLRSIGGYNLGVKAQGFLTHVQWVDIPDLVRPMSIDVHMARGLRISGRVVDAEAGTPVRNARVIYESVQKDEVRRPWYYPGSGVTERVWDLVHCSPKAGTFIIDGLRPGRYSLTAKAITGYVQATAVVTAPVDGVALRLSPSGVFVVRAHPWAGGEDDVLRATIFRSGSREIAANVAVRGGNGEVRVSSGLAVGAYDIDVDGGTLGFSRTNGRIQYPGETAIVEVTLEAPSRIRARLQSGAPLDGSVAFLDGHDAIWRLRPVAGSPASISVTPGDYRLQYMDRERVARPVSVRVGVGESREILFEDRPAVVVDVASDVSGSWICTDATGARRDMAIYRGAALAHIGDEAQLAGGERIVVSPEPGLQLQSLSDPSRSFALDSGTRYLLRDAGIQEVARGEGD